MLESVKERKRLIESEREKNSLRIDCLDAIKNKIDIWVLNKHKGATQCLNSIKRLLRLYEEDI
jgi:hypothetical protein